MLIEPKSVELPNEALATAKMVGLRYVTDTVPGFSRKRAKNGFRYLDAAGKPITDKKTIARIKSLVIPPAWEKVWISPWENGHIQATGRDAKNRKQYQYHSLWREVRDEAKYERMIGFGKALPLIRKGISEALTLPGLPREKVLATVIYLLQLTMMRIGNDEYAIQNQSYGLTTLRNKHVRIDGGEVRFNFRGKSGVEHSIKVNDKRLARIIKNIRDLPGQELFQYMDDEGNLHSISSTDVNEYLHQLTSENYTAKDFRTWSGTIFSALILNAFEKFETEAQAKKNVVTAIQSVAKKLGNTPTICRKCYVHPIIISAYIEGTLAIPIESPIEDGELTFLMAEYLILENALTAGEKAVLLFLENQIKNTLDTHHN